MLYAMCYMLYAMCHVESLCGLSLLLISADLEELIGLSDRIIVFYQGKLVKELDADNVSPEDLGGYMTGLKK